MIAGLNDYLNYIRADYAKCQEHRMKTYPEIGKEMQDRFNNGLTFVEGNKYIKVVRGTSVHSFICKKDTEKFKKGDILKALSWATPARNYARGNVIERKYNDVSWTGAL